MNKQKNSLINASSPYLLQHADNPVDWKEWNDSTLQQAKDENKLLLISIGYSACHWCHVMEKECFSNPAVAEIMNENFINIKVDREERPDVDQVYMDALQLMTGQGGWPLNVIALPDQRPVFGGTYFPREQWMELLQKVSGMFKQQPDSFEEYAGKLMRALQSLNSPQSLDAKSAVTKDQLQEMYEKIAESVDEKNGGLGAAPKFPLPSVWNSLLYYYVISGEKQYPEKTIYSLDKMQKGGIYDQIGGGFARYSTDDKWIVPHFEKMLYDNGQLLELYANAYRLTRNKDFAAVLHETLGFLKREMSGEKGEFFSALDADSEGEEGKFYVWENKEFRQACGDDAVWAEKYFGVGGQGYWENEKNILIQAWENEEMAQHIGMNTDDFEKRLNSLKSHLLKERAKKERPALDDKVLTSWNAMTISGLAASYKALGDKEFLNTALQNADFIRNHLIAEGKLYHNYHKGKASISGFLEDYAFWIKALCDLYEVTFEESYLKEAKDWTEQVIDRFIDIQSGLFYFTANDEETLIARKKELPDNVIPSSNSVMACNLVRLAHWFSIDEWKEYTDIMLKMIKPSAMKTPAFHGNWAVAMCMRTAPFYELAIAGPDAEKQAFKFEESFVPVKVLGVAKNGNSELPFISGKESADDKTYFYLCEDKVCQEPVDSPEKVMEQIRKDIVQWHKEK